MGFKYRILVVDDEPLIRQTSAMVLASNGYEVRTAGDGFEALIELRQALPDLIISDLSMPNMSGFELLSVVRRRFPEIPVIAITGKFDGTMPVRTAVTATYAITTANDPSDCHTQHAITFV